MVNTIDVILKYFPDLTEQQKERFAYLGTLYSTLNQQINVISRKDIESLYTKHVLHSLAVAKFISFKAGSEVVDLGTGGGFPGVPLAILFPDVRFLMIDGTAKKIKVVNEVISELELDNAAGFHKRSEELDMTFDFVLARAVTRLYKLLPMSQHLISKSHKNAIPNGLITLKGGDLTEELSEIPKHLYKEEIPISKYFVEEFFETKALVYVQF